MRAVLRFRNFRLLWLGQSASVIGDALVIVAIGLFVTRLTRNPTDVGIVLAAYAVPLAVFLLIGGVVADRLPRQRVMLTADTVRCLLHATLAVLIATGVVAVWQMVVIGVLYGSSQAFFQPAYTGLIPQTVDGDEHIQSAQALSGVSRELAEFASPALATALVLGVGAAWVFGIDSATFAVSASLLTRVTTRDRGTGDTGDGSVLRQLHEGWSALRARSWVWATIATFSFAMFVALAPFFVLGASVARSIYGSEAVFGIVNVAWGVGTVTGAVLGGRWRPHRPMYAGLLASLAWPAAIAVYALGPPVGLAYASNVVAGIGIGLFSVWWETALAERIPPELLSRVSAWDWMGSLCLVPLGYLLAGPVAGAVGAAHVLVVGGIAGSAVMALGLLPTSTRRMRRVEHDAAPTPLQPQPSVTL